MEEHESKQREVGQTRTYNHTARPAGLPDKRKLQKSMSMCVKDVNATSVRIHLSRGKDRLLVRVPSLVGRVKSDLCQCLPAEMLPTCHGKAWMSSQYILLQFGVLGTMRSYSGLRITACDRQVRPRSQERATEEWNGCTTT
jgi:hypothetical protein